MEIRKIYEEKPIGKEISVKGWIRKHRKQKEIGFIELSDGTCFKKIQVVYVTKLPLLKFVGLLAILLTFIIFNFILAGDREMHLNFMINSVLFHIILPLMYLIDWILFYEHKKIKWYYPLISVIFPVVYAIFIFIRAWILDFNPEVPYIYPYFFFNLDELGVVGVIKWIGILSLVFIIIGYTIFGLDKINFKNKKYSKKSR